MFLAYYYHCTESSSIGVMSLCLAQRKARQEEATRNAHASGDQQAQSETRGDGSVKIRLSRRAQGDRYVVSLSLSEPKVVPCRLEIVFGAYVGLWSSTTLAGLGVSHRQALFKGMLALLTCSRRHDTLIDLLWLGGIARHDFGAVELCRVAGCNQNMNTHGLAS